MSKGRKLTLESISEILSRYDTTPDSKALDVFKERHIVIINMSHASRRFRVRHKKAVMQLMAMNCITNIVTALEVYLKSVIIENFKIWRKEGISELLTQTITLAEAFELATYKKLKPVHLIVEITNFQNLNSINATFTKLIGADFLHNAGLKIAFDEANDIVNNWRAYLYELFNARNRIVHDAKAAKETIDNLPDYILVSWAFAHGVQFLVETIRDGGDHNPLT